MHSPFAQPVPASQQNALHQKTIVHDPGSSGTNCNFYTTLQRSPVTPTENTASRKNWWLFTATASTMAERK